MPDDDFGYTRWGKDWVRLAEPLTLTKPEPLLPRARSIARNGGVQLTIEGTMVQAAIHRGSEASMTYLELAPLSGQEAQILTEIIPADALTLSDAQRTAISERGISLAPRLTRVDCSCRARVERCVHFLATCYALAQKIDETPWLALDLQGFRTATTNPDTAAESRPARWTPINSLDPATYFTAPVA